MRHEDQRVGAVSPERSRILTYLNGGLNLSAGALALRFQDAVEQFDAAVDGVSATEAEIVRIRDEWTIA
jgi:hypothetical protein